MTSSSENDDGLLRMESINNRKMASTQLSRSVKKLRKHAETNERIEEGGWGLVEIGEGDEKRSILPKVLDQGQAELCILYSTYHLFLLQANILRSTRKDIKDQEPSFAYMFEIFKSLRKKTLHGFITKLARVHIKSNKEKVKKMVFSVDYHKNISPYEDPDFKQVVKHAIKKFGGVIIEYNTDKRRTQHPSDINFKEDGHAIVAVGWRGEEETAFDSLDSSGFGMGLNGRVDFPDSESIHHVYIPQLKFAKSGY